MKRKDKRFISGIISLASVILLFTSGILYRIYFYEPLYRLPWFFGILAIISYGYLSYPRKKNEY